MSGQGSVIIYDTEFTTWPGAMACGWSQEPYHHRELVQLAAIKLQAGQGYREAAQFSMIAQPLINPKVSEFFSDLTGITQMQIDAEGIPAEQVLENFKTFCGESKTRIVSNGQDINILAETAGLQGWRLPIPNNQFGNIRPAMHQAIETELGHAVIWENYPSGRAYELLDLNIQSDATHNALHDVLSLASTCLELERRGHRILPWSA